MTGFEFCGYAAAHGGKAMPYRCWFLVLSLIRGWALNERDTVGLAHNGKAEPFRTSNGEAVNAGASTGQDCKLVDLFSFYPQTIGNKRLRVTSLVKENHARELLSRL